MRKNTDQNNSVYGHVLRSVIHAILCQNFKAFTGEFWLLYQIHFTPQVKQSVIISNKHGIYELPQELPNYLRLRILGH